MRKAQIIGATILLLSATGCAKPEYVGNNAKGFWSDQPAEVSPTQAYQKAMPHLDATWAARCDGLRNHDHWCDELPLDHMMRKGKWYHVTRTAYPHKDYNAFLSYAVKVNADTGEVIPVEAPSSGADESAAVEE